MRLARQPLCAFHPLAHLQVLLCLDQLSLELSNLVWLSRGTTAQLGDACVWEEREGRVKMYWGGYWYVQSCRMVGRGGGAEGEWRERGGRVEGENGRHANCVGSFLG